MINVAGVSNLYLGTKLATSSSFTIYVKNELKLLKANAFFKATEGTK